ncbi:hypothetical protein ACOSP7_002411 [Xanthoceras sorbifolium]
MSGHESTRPSSKYVMLDDKQNLIPPPQRRNFPRYNQPHSKPSRGNSCIRCLCCCCCCLFFLIFLVTVIAYIVYALYTPHVPSYNVDKFEVTAFDVQPDFSTINSEISVTVRAENPNEGIGFIYGKESAVALIYTDKTLSTGKLPVFEQPKKNVSMIKVVLKGKSEFGTVLLQSLMADEKAGKVPLLVTVKAPIIVVIGDWPLRQVLVKLNCSLVVDNLTMGKKIKILSSKYDYQIIF